MSLLKCILFLVVPFGLHAHGDLHERIQAINRQIKTARKDFDLFQQRGELYLQHRQYRKARADFNICLKKGEHSARLYYCQAKTFYHLGKFQRSLDYLEMVFQDLPKDIKSIRLRSKVLLVLNENEQAAESLEQVLVHSIRTTPENYLEASSAWQMAGLDDRAISVLKKGIESLGPLSTLLKALIAIHQQNQDWDKILEIQNQIISQSARKENALYQRALTHHFKGDTPASLADLNAAQKAITSLPSHKQNSVSIKTLQNYIDQLMKEVQ